MIVNAKNSLMLQGGVVRASMLGRSTYATRADEEQGKKDDDRKFAPARRHNGGFPLRWRRKRVLLALLALVLFSLAMHFAGPRRAAKKSSHANPFAYSKPSYAKPAVDAPGWETREPTGAPPGVRAPRRGEAAPQVFDGALKFYRLARSLRGAAHTDGYRKVNRNVLFAAASLQSAATLLPLACEMAQQERNWVHVAFVGRADIPLEDILAINGVDTAACAAIWHDARPDYSEYSSEGRAQDSVQAALTHMQNFLHPQVAIVDDARSEDAFFTAGVRNQTRALGVPLIEVPADKADELTWMARLDAHALASWHRPTVDVLVQVPPDSSSVLYLLRSLAAADYAGLGYPRLTLELPASLDPTVQRALESFAWPPHSDSHSQQESQPSQLVLRRRIPSPRASQEDAAVHFAELFYPPTADAHVLLLSPHAQLAPQYFHYLKQQLLLHRYSAHADDARTLMGVSLELPATLVDGTTPLVLPSPVHHEKTPTPFLMQAPNTHAALFFADAWQEWHAFLSARVRITPYLLAHKKTPPPAAPRAKIVSETLPSWAEYMVEFMRARGYAMLYPGLGEGAALARVHNEMYAAPEEFGVDVDAEVDVDVDVKPDVDIHTPFLRAPSPPPHPLPHTPEPALLPPTQPLHRLFPFSSPALPLSALPYLLFNGMALDASSVAVVAGKYAAEFRSGVGGCVSKEGRRRVYVQGEVGDLFCFGEGGWEDGGGGEGVGRQGAVGVGAGAEGVAGAVSTLALTIAATATLAPTPV